MNATDTITDTIGLIVLALARVALGVAIWRQENRE
jgi:hypothetical protein